MNVVLTCISKHTNDAFLMRYPKLKTLNPIQISLESDQGELEFLIVDIDNTERLFEIFPTWVLYEKFETTYIFDYDCAVYDITHALLLDGYL